MGGGNVQNLWHHECQVGKRKASSGKNEATLPSHQPIPETQFVVVRIFGFNFLNMFLSQ